MKYCYLLLIHNKLILCVPIHLSKDFATVIKLYEYSNNNIFNINNDFEIIREIKFMGFKDVSW